jgi:hypothetical protein
MNNLIALRERYAAMSDDHLQRLALDVKSLLPEAREALRSEMERRHLPMGASIDWSAQCADGKPAPEKTQTSSGGFRRFARNFLIFAGCNSVYLLIIGGLTSTVHGIDIEVFAASLTKALLELSVALALITAWRQLKLRTLLIIGVLVPPIALVLLIILGHIRQTMR